MRQNPVSQKAERAERVQEHKGITMFVLTVNKVLDSCGENVGKLQGYR